MKEGRKEGSQGRVHVLVLIMIVASPVGLQMQTARRTHALMISTNIKAIHMGYHMMHAA